MPWFLYPMTMPVSITTTTTSVRPSCPIVGSTVTAFSGSPGTVFSRCVHHPHRNRWGVNNRCPGFPSGSTVHRPIIQTHIPRNLFQRFASPTPATNFFYLPYHHRHVCHIILKIDLTGPLPVFLFLLWNFIGYAPRLTRYVVAAASGHYSLTDE